jgi:uncharacterized protein YndB with AHSA1/START domain
MYFELSISIERPPADVFRFLRDKDKHPQEEGSPVLLLDKTTPGDPGVGTRYREVVQMLPFYRGEILSEITRFEPDEVLEEDFWGAGMEGHLAYQFLKEGQGTRLIQREALRYQGVLRLFEPVIRPILGRRLRERLEGIKAYLERCVMEANTPPAR